MKILVIGAFDFVNFDSGGQPVKTRELYYALQERYGKSNISYFETQSLRKSYVKQILKLVNAIRKNDVVIMLPAVNGVRVFAPLLFFLRKKRTKLFYSVIGGWLSTELEDKPLLSSVLKKFNGIWVETSSMKKDLEKIGFKNIATVKNFKHLNVLDENDLTETITYPIRLCTFSRVLEKKGIGDAITAVKSVNTYNSKKLLALDIYGPIDEGYADTFADLQSQFPDYIRYMGEKKPSESVEILRNYNALLFPTKFFTEGIPGTLIDAYSAGIPVITSLWMNSSDIFEDGVTGYGYEFGNYGQFESILRRIAENPQEITRLRKNCLEMAHTCEPAVVMNTIAQLIER